MIKLVVNNDSKDPSEEPEELDKKLTFIDPLSQDSFFADFQRFSPKLFVFRAKDHKHELSCEMVLELKETLVPLENEESYFAPLIACNLPDINVQKFQARIGNDEYLQGILMFLFQLKILEQLFLFCEEKDAINLTMTIRHNNVDYLEIYRQFFISEEQVETPKGMQTQIVIPMTIEFYDHLLDFIDEIEKDFYQVLWHDQRTNSVIRQYLKYHASVSDE